MRRGAVTVEMGQKETHALQQHELTMRAGNPGETRLLRRWSRQVLIQIKRKELTQRATLEPRVRALLGDRLRAYYAATQHLPLPDSLAEVIERLAQKESLANRQGE